LRRLSSPHPTVAIRPSTSEESDRIEEDERGADK
jgi:hypothetical protein